MGSIRPTTYNEIVMYQRCLRLYTYISNMDDALMEKIYSFMGQAADNNLRLLDGRLDFCSGSSVVESVAVKTVGTFTSVQLTRAALHVTRPFSYSGDGDSGVSGNNNNNNNNNNNG